jgi:choline dehydrogenase-like flavoprotein
MFLDTRSIPDGTVLEGDVCIVGAGAAGIALAIELAGRGRSVCLLESGGLEYEEDTQGLCAADENGSARADFDFARLRLFGGSTGHWGGNCAPFAAHELASRPWVQGSGWPIGAAELAPYFARAARYCALPTDIYDDETWARSSEDFERARLPIRDSGLVHKVFIRTDPVHFGEAYRETLGREDGKVRVFLHANAVEIETEPTGTVVTGIRTTDMRGRHHRFTAGTYILAAGPENARLMLLSNQARAKGIGNDHGLVGRYFMGHLRVYTGKVTLAARPAVTSFYSAERWKTLSGYEPEFYVGIQPSAAVQESEGILSCTAFLEADVEGKRGPALATLRQIMRSLRQGHVPDDLARDLGVVVADIDRIGYVAYRRFAGAPAGEPVPVNLRWFLEQAPNPESRLSLSDKKDALGLPKLRMDWSSLEIDKLTLIRTQELMAREFGRLGLGRIQATFTSADEPWPGVNLQAHFMGGTRMHVDPRQGVVDANCRVHGMPNLYVAGGSVFPTSGSTMPTANIVALAIRLADHLIHQV